MYFDTCDHLGVNHECDRQIDGQIDFLIPNAALRVQNFLLS